jgi:hypothetical protein
MIRVSVEIRSRGASFRVAVWAEGIAQAVDLASAHYPGCEAKVRFPIDREVFFVRGPVPSLRMVRLETPEEVAG